MTTDQEFSGDVILVTGAACGIGLAIARRFAEKGSHVLIADINEEQGINATKELRLLGFVADFICIDLSRPGGASTMIDLALQLTGRIDVLINNARAGQRVDLLAETEDNWNLALSVGLTSAFFASQSTIRYMSNHGGCRIVNVGSVAGTQVTLESPSYHASKAGLVHLTRYLAVAGGPHGARVNCVLPGLIIQERHLSRFDSVNNEAYRLLAADYQPSGQVGTESDVANAVLYFCDHLSQFVSGTCLSLDGGATCQEPFGLLVRNLISGKTLT